MFMFHENKLPNSMKRKKKKKNKNRENEAEHIGK